LNGKAKKGATIPGSGGQTLFTTRLETMMRNRPMIGAKFVAIALTFFLVSAGLSQSRSRNESFAGLRPIATPVAAGRPMIASAKGDPFTGAWTVSVTADDPTQGNNFDDVLTFKGDQFVSDAMSKRGFATTQYNEWTTPMGAASFDAKPHSDAQGDAAWHGDVAGDQLTGTLIWTKKDGTVVHFSYSGSKKQ
jgi:hypothetical protein